MADHAGDDAWLMSAEQALGRRDPAWPGGVASLLDDAFREVGASGRTWDHDAIAALLAQAALDDVRFDGFEVDRLSDDVALVTYRTIDPTRTTKRVSVWVCSDEGGWRVRYHQGTSVPEAT